MVAGGPASGGRILGRSDRFAADPASDPFTPQDLTASILHALGLHYRVRNQDLPGTPDMANRRRRWAVFVHGCFWHAHKGCPRATIPSRNRALWLAKFGRNRARDARATRALRENGFRVVVIWECELVSRARIRRRLHFQR